VLSASGLIALRENGIGGATRTVTVIAAARAAC